MALYAQQIAYTPLAWAALLKAPQNRLQAVQQVVERLGGLSWLHLASAYVSAHHPPDYAARRYS